MQGHNPSPLDELLQTAKPKADEAFRQKLASQIEAAITAKDSTMDTVIPMPSRAFPRLWLVAAIGLVLAGILLALTLPRPTEHPTAVLLTPTVSPMATAIDCIPMPQHGWLVHSVASHQTLDAIATNYGVTEEILLTANCLGADDALPLWLYIPLQTQQMVMTTQQLASNIAIKTDMVQTVWLSSPNGINADMVTTTAQVVDQYPIRRIPAYSLLPDRHVMSSPLISADRQTAVFVPREHTDDPLIFIGQSVQMIIHFTLCLDPAAHDTVIEGVVDCTTDYEQQLGGTIVGIAEDGVVMAVATDKAPVLQGAVEFDQQITFIASPPEPTVDERVTLHISIPEMYTEYWRTQVGKDLLVSIEITYLDITCSPATIDECITDIDESSPTRQDKVSIVAELVAVEDMPNTTDGQALRLKLAPHDAVMLSWAYDARMSIRFVPIEE